jgi:hypothetical protein
MLNLFIHYNLGASPYFTVDFLTQDFYDHPFHEDVVASMEQMEDCLDSDFVRSNLMNAAFCKFVYKYAGFASMTKREFKKKMSDPTSSAVRNLFEFLSPSDIAWAVLVYVSHEDLWKWEFQEYHKKKQVDIVHKDGDGQPIEYPKSPGKWRARGSIRQGSVGYTNEGRKLYQQLKKALKSVPAGDWVDVWSGFWATFAEKPTFVRKTTRGQANNWEDAAIDEELDDSIVEHLEV